LRVSKANDMTLNEEKGKIKGRRHYGWKYSK
jgi:hypothetical protein